MRASVNSVIKEIVTHFIHEDDLGFRIFGIQRQSDALPVTSSSIVISAVMTSPPVILGGEVIEQRRADG